MRTFGRLARPPFLGCDTPGSEVAALCPLSGSSCSTCGVLLTFSPKAKLLVPKQALVENATWEPPSPPKMPENEVDWTTEWVPGVWQNCQKYKPDATTPSLEFAGHPKIEEVAMLCDQPEALPWAGIRGKLGGWKLTREVTACRPLHQYGTPPEMVQKNWMPISG